MFKLSYFNLKQSAKVYPELKEQISVRYINTKIKDSENSQIINKEQQKSIKKNIFIY